MRGNRVPEGSVKTRKVGFSKAQHTADLLPSGLDSTLVLLLNGTGGATLWWATAAVI